MFDRCTSTTGTGATARTAFVVGLSEIYLKAQFHAGLAAVASNVVQRLDAIDGWLALAEHVQVRAVKNKNRFQKCRPFPARKVQETWRFYIRLNRLRKERKCLLPLSTAAKAVRAAC